MKLKTIILLFTLTALSYNIHASLFNYIWGEDVEAVWDFDGNGNDTSGKGHHLVKFGTPAYTQEIVARGTHAFAPDTISNYFTFPTALNQYLATLNEINIEGLIYLINANSEAIWFCRRQDSGNGAMCFNWWTNDNGSTLPTFGYQWNTSWNNFGRNYFNAYYSQYVHISIQYKNTDGLRIFLNGNQIVYNSSAQSKTNPFSVSTNDTVYISRSGFGIQSLMFDGYIDRIVISSKIRNGIETMPIAIPKMKYINFEDMIFNTDMIYFR